MIKKSKLVVGFALCSLALGGGAMYFSKPRGIRNKNPLNIRENDKVDFAWVGESAIDTDPEFEEFKTPEDGIRAAARIMKTYRDKHGLKTIRGIVTRWAPPNENDTESYIKSVSQKMQLFPDSELVEGNYPQLVAAMIYHENGQQPYSMDLIRSGVQRGFA